jgi:hypothetical protein
MKRQYWGVLLALAAGMSAALPLASAEPFLLRYDPGYAFPEEEGWQRLTYDPEGLLRRDTDGTFLTLDSSASDAIADSYWADGPGINPSAGEELRVTWRMQTIQTQTDNLRSDVTLLLSRSEPTPSYVELFLGPDYVSEGYGPDGHPVHVYSFSPGLHDFELVSNDLSSYALCIDGAVAFTGELGRPGGTGPFRVCFGDSVIGLSSISQWDYVQVAVVPEPGGLAAAAVIVALATRAMRRRGNA